MVRCHSCLLCLTPANEHISDCPNGFVHIDNRCFKVDTVRRNFGSHNYWCAERASTLFTPVSKKDFALVDKLMELYEIDQALTGTRIVISYSDYLPHHCFKTIGLYKRISSNEWTAESGESVEDIPFAAEPNEDIERMTAYGMVERGKMTVSRIRSDTSELPSICEYCRSTMRMAT